MVSRFHREHDREYGFKAESEPVEIVALRLSAIGRIPKPAVPEIATDEQGLHSAMKSPRRVYFEESGGFVECQRYDRYRLGAGQVIAGPAIVEEVDSTTVIHPGLPGRCRPFREFVPTSGFEKWVDSSRSSLFLPLELAKGLRRKTTTATTKRFFGAELNFAVKR